MYKKWNREHYLTIGKAQSIEWIGEVEPASIVRSTRWRCRVCGHEFNTSFHNVKNGAGCRRCATRKTQIPEQAYRDYADQNGFTYLGGYSGNVNASVEWECPEGHRWQARFAAVSRGTRCPECSSSRKKTEDDYRLAGDTCGFTYVGGYTGTVKDKVAWRCAQGHIFQANYDHIVNHKQGCSKCAHNQPKQEAEYHALAEQRGFEYLGGYTGSVLKSVTWRCGKGHVWNARYDNIRSGKGCPACSESSGERKIAEVLDRMGTSYEREKRFPSCRGKRELMFDFYFVLGGVAFLVEYDGIQHFEALEFFGGEKALKSCQERDRIKNEWAKENGYRLIRIPYTVDDISTFLTNALQEIDL